MSQVQINAMQFAYIQKCLNKYNYITNVHIVYAGYNCSECTGDEQEHVSTYGCTRTHIPVLPL